MCSLAIIHFEYFLKWLVMAIIHHELTLSTPWALSFWSLYFYEDIIFASKLSFLYRWANLEVFRSLYFSFQSHRDSVDVEFHSVDVGYLLTYKGIFQDIEPHDSHITIYVSLQNIVNNKGIIKKTKVYVKWII